MFRFSQIVCFSLIFGITAKPYEPWNKLTDEAFQDTVMSIDDKGKMSWGVEVEPPEDMDQTDYDIDPSMRIWKSMTGQDKQPMKAEEDFDELYHPSMVDLLKVQFQNLDAFPAADIQAEPWREDANIKYNQEPEEDKDAIDHPDFKVAKNKAGEEVHVAHSELEKDEDELYHHEGPPVQMELLSREVMGESEVRVHLQPEEDMDDLYHKDPMKLIPYQDDTKAAAPVYLPSQRKHSEPEEDLDDLYHR
ncbi:uncharacterized protein si:ch211-217g15.3 [Etheostoma spectabile]|uniref:Uncharacterized protein n=1 Tax=Etheostoma spectabile TaxID=54343 RepID=A0A5J5CQ62_9PERO|nr:uncharacterized protein LOC116704977 [Etheostoma spectabile]KAA8583847.1 hypothetical protein FQN60_015055 [Etheostoma spectabile]